MSHLPKTTISIKGLSGQGKSEVIKLLVDLIKSKYRYTETILIDDGDIKIILEINDFKIGIESQGDPKSRQRRSIIDFINEKCDIIICACRTKGSTARSVLQTQNHGYRIIWGGTYRSSQVPFNNLNVLCAESFLILFDEIISGKL